MSESIGFLGLGNLGLPMAENLVAAGERLVVWNRTREKTEAFVQQVGPLHATLAAAPRDAARCGVVFSILWDDASVEEVVKSEGFLDALRGGIHVSMSTIAPATARRLAELHAAAGSRYVEAPLFGVPAQVAARTLIFNLAGPAEAKARVRQYFAKLGAERVEDFGDVGGGTTTKLVGNFMLITAMAAMRESFDVLSKAGVDPKQAFDMLTSKLLATPGLKRTSAALTTNGTLPISAIGQKDIELFTRFAEAAGARSPLADRVGEILRGW